jgi:hypothetical protein
MRFRDTLKFALELFLPERFTHPGGNAASNSRQDASPNAAATSLGFGETGQVSKARRIIEELDHGQFGGPSFGPQTIELMSNALQDAEASLLEPASDQQLRLSAATLLKVAGEGERDRVRLKAAAMSALRPVVGDAREKPLT